MRTKKFGIILLAILAVLASTALLAAQHGPRFHKRVIGSDGEGMADHLAERLDLNEEQKASLKTFVEQFHNEIAPIREQNRALHEEIQKELEAGNPNATAIGERVIAAHANREKMKAAHDAFKERLGSILNEEQKKDLEEMHERMHMRHVEGGHGMHFGFRH
jgi:hypothetical protein